MILRIPLIVGFLILLLAVVLGAEALTYVGIGFFAGASVMAWCSVAHERRSRR